MTNMSTRKTITRAKPGLLASLLILMLLASHGVAGDTDSAAGPPRGVHLSYTDDPQTTMTVTWFTSGTTDPGTQVQYGPTTSLGSSVTGTSSPAVGIDVLTHEATITGLTAGQKIYYRAGSPGSWTPTYNFTTAPAAGDETFRFVIFGDHGIDLDAQSTTEWVTKANPDLIIVAGDVSYAEREYHEWDTYFDLVEPLASHIPYMAAIGNHEFVPPEGTTDFRNRFAFPGAELFYSFDYGNIHFLIVQSDMIAAWQEPYPAPGLFLPTMIQFMEDDLADAAARRDAGELDFIIVVQHHPLYSNTERESRRVEAGLLWEEQFLHRYEVDMLVTGHNHNYERSFPVAYTIPTEFATKTYRDPIGFIQVISGGAGRSLYDFVHEDDFMPFAAAAVKRHHFMQFDVNANELRVRAITSDLLPGQTIDDFRLITTPATRQDQVEDRLESLTGGLPPDATPLV